LTHWEKRYLSILLEAFLDILVVISKSVGSSLRW